MFTIKPEKATFGILPSNYPPFEPDGYDAYSLDVLEEAYEDLGMSDADAGIMQGYLLAG